VTEGPQRSTAMTTPGALVPDRWAQAIAAHQHRVVLSLVAVGFSFERAGDLANEAWARLIEKDRAGTLGEVKLPGLAIVQARYLAWDERRREALQARHHQQTAAVGEELLVDRNPDPEQRLLSRQQARQALAAVAAAPLSAQRLLQLLYAEPGLPHAQAAAALGLSVQRVRQILCELRKRVRAVLEGEPS
jgi:RNA polymerase sigma factor (sigma-70 family)